MKHFYTFFSIVAFLASLFMPSRAVAEEIVAFESWGEHNFVGRNVMLRTTGSGAQYNDCASYLSQFLIYAGCQLVENPLDAQLFATIDYSCMLADNPAAPNTKIMKNLGIKMPPSGSVHETRYNKVLGVVVRDTLDSVVWQMQAGCYGPSDEVGPSVVRMLYAVRYFFGLCSSGAQLGEQVDNLQTNHLTNWIMRGQFLSPNTQVPKHVLHISEYAVQMGWFIVAVTQQQRSTWVLLEQPTDTYYPFTKFKKMFIEYGDKRYPYDKKATKRANSGTQEMFYLVKFNHTPPDMKYFTIAEDIPHFACVWEGIVLKKY